MDAARALTLATLAALIAAGFAPLAGAEIGSPSVPDATYDASAKKLVAGGPIAYLDARDLSVVNLDTRASVLWLCDSALAGYKSAVVDSVRRSVAFTSVSFLNAGTWSVRESCTADASALASFGVESRDHYDVVVSLPRRASNVVVWSPDPEYLTLVVVDRMNGRAPVPGADIVLYKGTPAERIVRSDANGFWDTEEPLPGAGSFVIEAYANTAGDPSYETFGRTVLHIGPRGLVATRVGEAPLAGYTNAIPFKVAASTTAPNLLTTAAIDGYTLNLVRPDGTVATLTGKGAAKEGELEVAPDGHVVVTTRWTTGAYSLTLRANAAGTSTASPEWVQTWLVAADLAGKHDLVVASTPGRILAGEATTLTFKVTKDASPFAADVYLLTQDEATRLHAGTLSLGAVPAERRLAADEAVEPGVYRLRVALPAAGGPYVVHAREPGTPRHDNAGAEPIVAVEAAKATFSPARLAYGLQRDVPIVVQVTGPGGRPLTGTLSVAADGSTGQVGMNGTQTVVSIVDGTGWFTAAPIGKGRIAFDFASADSSLPAQRADGLLFVERPAITVAPRTMRLGADTAVEVLVQDLAGNPLTGLKVELCGTPFAGCTPAGLTDAKGKAIVHGAPIIAGTLALRVNGVDVGETVEATSRVSPNIVLGDPVLETRRVIAGDSFSVRVPVTNTGDATGLVTLTLNVDGSQAAQQTVEIPAGQTVPVILAAAVSQVGTYSVSVAAGSATRGGLTVTALPNEVPVEPSVPGFEAIAALAALGLVGFALRRRR